jgi:hypothetical protein
MSRRAVVKKDLDKCVERAAALKNAGACTLKAQLGGKIYAVCDWISEWSPNYGADGILILPSNHYRIKFLNVKHEVLKKCYKS